MTHGVTNGITDSFTGNGRGQTVSLPTATDPDFPVLAHVVSVCTITGTVTGAALSYEQGLCQFTISARTEDWALSYLSAKS